MTALIRIDAPRATLHSWAVPASPASLHPALDFAFTETDFYAPGPTASHWYQPLHRTPLLDGRRYLMSLLSTIESDREFYATLLGARTPALMTAPLRIFVQACDALACSTDHDPDSLSWRASIIRKTPDPGVGTW